MGLDENKALVEKMWGIVNSHDLSRFGEVYDAEILYHEGGGSERQGLAEFSAYVQTFYTAFPDLKLSLEDMVAEGEKVFSRARFSGTNSGELMGLPATGRAVDIEWLMSVCRIEDGKIVEEWEIFNLLDMLQQLGLGG